MIAEGKEKKTFVLTCTASSAHFPRYREEFDRVLSSLTLEPVDGEGM